MGLVELTSNALEMYLLLMQPMVIFSSRNHYNKTMIFGVAIVFDETIET